MKTFKELAASRYSCRKYKSQKVEAEKIQAILEAGLLAPTAVNYQPQKIYVIQSEDNLNKIRSLTKMVFNAPVVMLMCYDETISWKNKREPGHDCGEMDVCIVGTHMMLEAEEQGLKSLWARAYDTKKIEEAFGLPEHIHLCFLLSLGYPVDDDQPSSQHTKSRTLEETTTYL